MRCPNDGAGLNESTYESDIQIDLCNRCGGIWLDYGELERIQDAIERDYSNQTMQIPDLVIQAYNLALAKTDVGRECPKCQQALDRREYGYTSQILIDVCANCRGVWLDRGELEALEIFFERSRKEASSRGFFASLIELFRE